MNVPAAPPPGAPSPQPDGATATIVLRPIGASLTLGLAGLAMASFVLAGLDLGWVPVRQGKDVGVLVLVLGSAPQLVACVLAFLARDGTAGGVLGILSGIWAGVGILHIVSPPGSTANALGLGLLAAGTLLMGSSPTVGMGKLVPAAAFGLAGARFAVSGVYQLTANGAWQEASGIVGLVVAAIAAYAAWAFEMEDAKRHPVLPTLRRGAGAMSIEGSLPDQLAGVENEAGVRQQL